MKNRLIGNRVAEITELAVIRPCDIFIGLGRPGITPFVKVQAT